MSAIRAAAFASCIFGTLFTLGMMVYAGSGWRQGAEWWLSFMVFGLWSLVPYAGLVACGLLANRTKGQALTALIGSALVVCLGVLLLVDGFFIHPDAQSALVFIVLPFYQLAGVVVLILIIRRMGRRVS
jgi:hypothetical protein